MATALREWIEEVEGVRDRPLRWISEHHFGRDPARPVFSDRSFFFAPADGIILYQRTVDPADSILDIKGKSYSLRDALRDPHFDERCLVIGTFMTFVDVHVNRIPYPGRLSYRQLDPIDTHNHPMLDVEKELLDRLRLPANGSRYLHHNQRVVNRIDSRELRNTYFLLQIADYDIDCITPFELKQNQPVHQGERFSMIRYGSQVDLIVPLSERYELSPTQQPGFHVKAGIDTLIAIRQGHQEAPIQTQRG